MALRKFEIDSKHDGLENVSLFKYDYFGYLCSISGRVHSITNGFIRKEYLYKSMRWIWWGWPRLPVEEDLNEESLLDGNVTSTVEIVKDTWDVWERNSQEKVRFCSAEVVLVDSV